MPAPSLPTWIAWIAATATALYALGLAALFLGQRQILFRPDRSRPEPARVEQDVVVTAKRGEYRGKGDTVFTASKIDNVTIRGEGATVRMHKEDYIVGTVLKQLNWQRWYGQ